MFSYALRQIQPRSVSPSRARLPVNLPSLIPPAFSKRRDSAAGDEFTCYADRPWGSDPLLSTRKENARPSLNGARTKRTRG